MHPPTLDPSDAAPGGARMADYKNPNVLVDTDWVAQRANDPKVAIVEVDEDSEAFERGHVPGAIGFNWRTDLQDPVRRDMISKEGMEQLLSANGIGNDTTI